MSRPPVTSYLNGFIVMPAVGESNGKPYFKGKTGLVHGYYNHSSKIIYVAEGFTDGTLRHEVKHVVMAYNNKQDVNNHHPDWAF